MKNFYIGIMGEEGRNAKFAVFTNKNDFERAKNDFAREGDIAKACRFAFETADTMQEAYETVSEDNLVEVEKF